MKSALIFGKYLQFLLLVTIISFSSLTIAAEPYPNKPIKIVVGYPPGGFNDLVARLVATKLSTDWKVPVVVENAPGAAGQIATQKVAQSEADGYTLLVASFAHATNLSIRKSLPYDTQKDFSSVALFGVAPNVLVVRADSPFNSTQDLIAAAKLKPGVLSYGSSGAGASPHLAMEMFKSAAGVDIVHVPYKGGAPMINGLLGGEIDVIFENIPNVLPFISSKKMKALSVSSATRTPLLPGVPTTAEGGLPGFEMQAWWGLMVRAGTSEAVIDKLNSKINEILRRPDVQTYFAQQKVVPKPSSPQETNTFISTQIQKWKQVVEAANITLD